MYIHVATSEASKAYTSWSVISQQRDVSCQCEHQTNFNNCCHRWQQYALVLLPLLNHRGDNYIDSLKENIWCNNSDPELQGLF